MLQKTSRLRINIMDVVEFPAMDNINEKALIENAQKGDREAFGEIYKLYFKRLFRFIYYMVNDRELSEDLTQNAMLKIWKNISLYSSDRGSPVTFFFSIAKNMVIDHLRKPKIMNLNEIGEIKADDDQIERLETIEAEESVKKMLLKLEDSEKQIIIMRYFEDLQYSEIAGILKIKETAVRVRVHRILLKLKSKFPAFAKATAGKQNSNIK